LIEPVPRVSVQKQGVVSVFAGEVPDFPFNTIRIFVVPVGVDFPGAAVGVKSGAAAGGEAGEQVTDIITVIQVL
jgi:hypothetical protein